MTSETLLHRQIHPNFYLRGASEEVASLAFKPSEGHAYKLSVYDGDAFTAQASWAHYTAQPDHLSCGVLSITPGECAGIELPAVESPEVFPGHVHIDFSACTSGARTRKAKALRDKAMARGWQFRPHNTGDANAG